MSSPANFRCVGTWRSLFVPRRLRSWKRSLSSTSDLEKQRHQTPLRVRERIASSVSKSNETIYKESSNSASWKIEQTTDTGVSVANITEAPSKVIRHFLPAKYPTSVAPGYTHFITYSFGASVAGSAAMVLSTQTLLLAVGVVGSNSAQTASVMAGALNWVLKDGIGQLGGVLFASRMGQTKRFDSNPKRWRMFAALSLDSASLVEILSPMMVSTLVLPAACFANVLKNISFLTAGASRAAIHQSLAVSGNLGDVTAKSGSQAMAAGLIGTGGGVTLSWLLGQDPNSYIVGFCTLSLIHQACNFLSLQSITMTHFDRQRLHLLLEEFLKSGEVLSPSQVAEREAYFPLTSEIDGRSWLSIGEKLSGFCDSTAEFRKLHEACEGEKYILGERNGKTNLVFMESAESTDEIMGMLHAMTLKQEMEAKPANDTTVYSHIVHSKHVARQRLTNLILKMEGVGWRVGKDLTNIEGDGAVRLTIEK